MNRSVDHVFATESSAMRFFRWCGSDGVAWSLRRLHCPVSHEALVLEVGSGGNPYPRANVLLDAYEETRERHWAPLVTDRTFVLGFVENLPFRTSAFDFLIASHVLEHSKDPERTLSEFQRVAKAGYIEVPDAFMERMNPYRDHRLEITARNGRLLIRKKPNWVVDPELVELYEARVKAVMTGELMRRRPFHFHVRYYWREKIDFEILDPTEDICWPPPVSPYQRNLIDAGTVGTQLHTHFMNALRKLLSQKKRNSEIDILSLLRCPTCVSDEALRMTPEGITCSECHALYPVRDGIPVMLAQSS